MDGYPSQIFEWAERFQKKSFRDALYRRRIAITVLYCSNLLDKYRLKVKDGKPMHIC